MNSRATNLLLTLLCWAWAPMQVYGQDGQLERIVRDWGARRHLASSLLLQVRGTQTIAAHNFDTDLPKEDHVSEKTVTWLFHVGNNWVRKETYDFRFFDLGSKLRDFVPCYQVELFDGKDAVAFQPREKNTSRVHTPSEFQPDVTYYSPSHAGVFFDPFFDLPVFLALGLVPTSQQRPTPTRISPSLDASEFFYHGSGTLNGVSCVVVRTSPNKSGGIHEYWVDPSRLSAIIRYKYYYRDKIKGLADITYSKTTSGWLPDGWTVTHYKTSGELATVNEAKVTQCELNPPVTIDDFQAKLEPGRIVAKVPLEKYYRVKSDGTLADIVFIDNRGTWGPWPWILSAVAILLVLGVGLNKWKKLRSART